MSNPIYKGLPHSSQAAESRKRTEKEVERGQLEGKKARSFKASQTPIRGGRHDFIVHPRKRASNRPQNTRNRRSALSRRSRKPGRKVSQSHR